MTEYDPFRLFFVRIPFGGIAQLGEHLLCKQGVRGSSPLISTSPKGDRKPRDFLYGLIAQLVRARA